MKCHDIQSHEASRRNSRKGDTSKVKKNVVSLRVTDKERKLLERLTKKRAQSVSDVVRDAIVFWISKQKACRQS